MTQISYNRKKKLLQDQLDKVAELKRLSYDAKPFQTWRNLTEAVIVEIFGEDSRHTKNFEGIYFFPLSFVPGGDPAVREHENRQAYIQGLDYASAILDSMIAQVELFDDEDSQSGSVASSTGTRLGTDTNKVFVVHGRDIGTKDTVTRFLEALDLEPVVLQEQPDRGRTVIEKFEEYADQCGFAVILCTPDDFGGLDSDNGETEQRARQNVIFELGFFVGKLGRGFVSLMVKGDVKIPTDYVGVLHTKLDESGGWKNQLVGELKSAGFEVDANRLYESTN